jgi:hypothetical protein
MAITTYAELKTAVADWLDRSDLNDYMDDFIKLGETYLMHGGGVRSEPLRVRDMEATATLSPTSNVYTIPSDFLSAKSVTALTSPRRPLEFISPAGADSIYPYRTTDYPNHYMIVGNSLTALPYTSSDVEIIYYKTIEGLSDANTSNWLLAKNPDLYLRVVQMQAAEFIKDNQQAGVLMGLVDRYISQLNDAESFDDYRNVGVNISGFVV